MTVEELNYLSQSFTYIHHQLHVSDINRTFSCSDFVVKQHFKSSNVYYLLKLFNHFFGFGFPGLLPLSFPRPHFLSRDRRNTEADRNFAKRTHFKSFLCFKELNVLSTASSLMLIHSTIFIYLLLIKKQS